MAEIHTRSEPVSGDGHRPTPSERRRYGRARRAAVPRRAQAAVIDPGLRPDPALQLALAVTTHDREHAAMQRDLLLASPAAWYEGTPAFAVADLAPTPRSGIRVQIYGDAAIGRFAPIRAEGGCWLDVVGVPHTLPGPWEWDLKRLVTSVALEARRAGHSRAQQDEAALTTVAAYREKVADLAGRAPLDVWGLRVAADEMVEEASADKPKRSPDGRRATLGARPKVVGRRRGGHRIASRPPGVMPLEGEPENQGLAALFHRYLAALPDDRWTLARRFDYLDGARVLSPPGLGANHHWLALLGDDTGRHLVLRFEEARPSALAGHLTDRRPAGREGHRIVTGWRLLSPARDPFLGAIVDTASDRDLVVSQHRPVGPTLVAEHIRPGRLRRVARAAAEVIATGHARSGDATELAGYLGSGDALDQALALHARLAADQAERDHAGAMAAVRGLAASSAPPVSLVNAPESTAVPGTPAPADLSAGDSTAAPRDTSAGSAVTAAGDGEASTQTPAAVDVVESADDGPDGAVATGRDADVDAGSATPLADAIAVAFPAAHPDEASPPERAASREEAGSPADAVAEPAVPPVRPTPTSTANDGYAGSLRPWSDHQRSNDTAPSWDDLADDDDSPTEYVEPDLSTVDPPSWATGDVEPFGRPADSSDDVIPSRRWPFTRLRRRSTRP